MAALHGETQEAIDMWNSILSWDRPFFGQLDQLRHDLDSLFSETGFSDIRSAPRGSFPLINVGESTDEVRVYVFAPGMNPDDLDVNLQNNVLSIQGRRSAEPGQQADKGMYHRRERFDGEFARAVSLPETVDPDAVEANFKDGVLTVTVKKRAEVQPRRIKVKARK